MTTLESTTVSIIKKMKNMHNRPFKSGAGRGTPGSKSKGATVFSVQMYVYHHPHSTEANLEQRYQLIDLMHTHKTNMQLIRAQDQSSIFRGSRCKPSSTRQRAHSFVESSNSAGNMR